MTTETPIGESRDVLGETVLGMRVAAYREPVHSKDGDYIGNRYSEHWSTPGKDAEVERLFLEADVRAALSVAPQARGGAAISLSAEGVEPRDGVAGKPTGLNPQPPLDLAEGRRLQTQLHEHIGAGNFGDDFKLWLVNNAPALLQAAEEREMFRQCAEDQIDGRNADLSEFARELSTLQSERDRAVEALRPFARSIAPEPECISGWRFGVKPTTADAIRAHETYADLSKAITPKGGGEP